MHTAIRYTRGADDARPRARTLVWLIFIYLFNARARLKYLRQFSSVDEIVRRHFLRHYALSLPVPLRFSRITRAALPENIRDATSDSRPTYGRIMLRIPLALRPRGSRDVGESTLTAASRGGHRINELGSFRSQGRIALSAKHARVMFSKRETRNCADTTCRLGGRREVTDDASRLQE